MNKLLKILAFLIIFVAAIMFTEPVSAVNWTVNPENSVQSVINNTSDNNRIIINDNNDSTNIYFENSIVNKKLPLTAVSGENEIDNQINDVQMVDTTGIVMSSTTYNCGPATLATVLQKLSINETQDTLASLAGTDENGTTMYGLIQAAQQKGVIAKGLKLKVNELKPGNIVYLIIDYEDHYSIITSITDTTFYLADTDLGNIKMTLENFTAAYIQNATTGYGYALVVTNNSTDPQLSNNNTLTDDEMKAIKGTGSAASTYKPTHPRIAAIAHGLMSSLIAQTFMRNTRITYLSKAKAIWNWLRSYMKVHKPTHLDTIHTVDQILDWHEANCAEMSRLVRAIAQALGIPSNRIQIVHKLGKNRYNKGAGHYWPEIKVDSGQWVAIDGCAYAYFKYADKLGGHMDQDGHFGGWTKVRVYNDI